MSDGKIRGRPPGAPPVGETPVRKSESKRGAGQTQATQGQASEPNPSDFFEHSAAVGAKLQDRLQPLTKRAQAAKIQFSNKDIEQLAVTFASIIASMPDADRLKRARKFAEAVLKQEKLKKLRKLFDGLTEREMDNMCDAIGEVLNDSPLFGQMVDNVTEGASKLGTS